MRTTGLHQVLAALRGPATADRLTRIVALHGQLLVPGVVMARAEIAMSLTLLLFDDLLAVVPEARDYVGDLERLGRTFVFDHGALRTVQAQLHGELPGGEACFTRILGPLGYTLQSVYPLDRLGMTGRAYAQADFPEHVPQFFVSELHPEGFSPEFRAALAHVLGTSRDPLDSWTREQLDRLAAQGKLPVATVIDMLPSVLRCFARCHALPRWADYETLRAESAEAAWIATEGGAFNHATDRVADIEAVARAQRAAGRSIKERIEVSATGRVKQTAFRAATMARAFVTAEESIVFRDVPGSFHEIIERQTFRVPEGSERLDLGFDTGNAQEIFKMTRGTDDHQLAATAGASP